MQRPNQFMEVAFTEHQPEKRALGAAWPQHLTVIPWVEQGRLQATDRLRKSVTHFGPLRLDIVGERELGSRSLPVWTLGPCDILHQLHKQVREAVVCNGTEWAAGVDAGRPYLPHVTQVAGQPEYAVGDRLVLPELSIIGYHEVLGKIAFNNVRLDGNEAAA